MRSNRIGGIYLCILVCSTLSLSSKNCRDTAATHDEQNFRSPLPTLKFAHMVIAAAKC